jgi:putative Holliday junction resolvase
MKHMGIDYGTRRIGVATSDDTGSMAFPLTTVEAGREAVTQIAELAKKSNIEKIIIGESKNFKNEPNDVMEDIEQFKKDLAELSGLPVEYEPEFMTSAQALRQGLDKRGEGEKQKSNLDASAAALILQAYLDRHKVQ